MDNAYSRNIAQRQLCVSDFAQIAFIKNASLESPKEGPAISLANSQQMETESSDAEFQESGPMGWALKIPSGREKADVLKKDKKLLRLYVEGAIVGEAEQNDPIAYAQSSPIGGGSDKGILLRCVEIECLNGRFFNNRVSRRRVPFTSFQIRNAEAAIVSAQFVTMASTRSWVKIGIMSLMGPRSDYNH